VTPLLLSLVNALVAQGALTPAFFAETALGALVNAEIRHSNNRANVIACQIWENLVRKGSSGNGIEINAVLDLIDTENGYAAHAALRLMETLLRESPDRGALVFALVSASPTDKGFLTFVSEKVKKRDYETSRACAACTALIVLGANPVDMEVLADPRGHLVGALFDFLKVEDARLELLRALRAIFEFVQARGGEQWADIKQQWFEADGPEWMLEITQDDEGLAFVEFQDQFFAMLESDDED
jgi:hypothetical protein